MRETQANSRRTAYYVAVDDAATIMAVDSTSRYGNEASSAL